MADDPLTPLDLGALDPTSRSSFDARARSIASDAMRARARRPDLLSDLLAWRGPALAAAAIIAIVAIPTLARVSVSAPPPVVVAEASVSSNILGIPDAIIDLTRSPASVSVEDLAAAVAPTEVSRGH